MYTCANGIVTETSYTTTDCTGSSTENTYVVNGEVTCTTANSGTMYTCGAAEFSVNESGSDRFGTPFSGVLYFVVACIYFLI